MTRRPRRSYAGVVLICVALVGLMSASASLFVPVDVAFADDPILRLQPFDGTAPRAVSGVDCGNAFDGLKAPADDRQASFYELAKDRACRREASRRAVSAGAAAVVVLAVSLLALACAAVGARSNAR